MGGPRELKWTVQILEAGGLRRWMVLKCKSGRSQGIKLDSPLSENDQAGKFSLVIRDMYGYIYYEQMTNIA